MTDTSKVGIHPDADAINAFAEHRLPAHERDQMLSHLAVCPACREVLALSSATDPKSVQPAAEGRWAWRWGLGLSLSGGVLAVITLIFAVSFYNKSSLHRTSVNSDQVAVSHSAPLAPEAVPQSISPPPPQSSAKPEREKTEARSQARSEPGKQADEFADRLKQVEPAARIDQNSVASKDAPAAPPSLSNRNSVALPSVAGHSIAAAAPSNEALADSAPSALAKANPIAIPARAFASLPSGRPTLSLAFSLPRAVAIDTANQVFVSSDAGQTWKHIVSPWAGQAVKAGLVAASSRSAAFDSIQGAVQKSEFAAVGNKPAIGRGEADTTLRQVGIVEGTVSDRTGTAVAGAAISLKEEANTQTRSGVSDSRGHFVIADVPAGKYDLKTEAPGFQEQFQRGIQVSADHPIEANTTLDVASASETVAVESAQTVLQNSPSASQSKKKSDAARPDMSETFQITTDTGEVWLSSDGTNWRRNAQ